MLKKIIYIIAILFLLLPAGCRPDAMQTVYINEGEDLPDGTPVTLMIPFSSIEHYEVQVGTKAEASAVDESRIHNLYVMIFDNGHTVNDGSYENSPRKIYGRYFSYDHLTTSLNALNSDDHEGWYVKNKVLDDSDEIQTEGAVKISTQTCSDATLVVIANVTNAVSNLDGMNSLERLKAIRHLKELQDVQVRLDQDIVNRKDLFLMTGQRDGNTKQFRWNKSDAPAEYNPDFRVRLTPVDAKVKFRVKYNKTNISEARPVYWQVCNTPDRCFLFPKDKVDGHAPAPDNIDYFASQQYYFENTETVGDDTYYIFTFYMLENDQPFNRSSEKYYQRELREKFDSGVSGYEGKVGPESGAFGDHFVENGDWKYAPTFGTYVCFDLVLTLTPAGIAEVGDVDAGALNITQALTSDAIFTVHLGDFVNSGDRTLKEGTPIEGSNFDKYETQRGHYYTYTVTINNTTNIFAEVTDDVEEQSGQEGYLLLTDTEIINADCHYEYHQITFYFNEKLVDPQNRIRYSWYVKTPFGAGEPKVTFNHTTGEYSYDATGLDYKWVMFGINETVLAEDDPGYETPNEGEPGAWIDRTQDPAVTVRPYTMNRHAYPGDSLYHPDWTPGEPNHTTHAHMVTDDNGASWKERPDLMDITQLIQYVFYQTQKEADAKGSSDFIYDSASDVTPVIRATAFIDEYYYTHDPTKPGTEIDPDVWRKFVNAQPREMHILSDARQSRDRKSDVILSSHSIIQQSIQTIYNIYSSNLRSIWGTEHQDEMRDKSLFGWPYWPDGKVDSGRAGEFTTVNGKENGRLNSAYIWGLFSKKHFNDAGAEDYTAPGYASKKEWRTYLNHSVHNNIPELKDDYHGMAWSCLTRNRDNNGDGKINRDEIRWYLAAPNQLIGMWIGNESLSMSARLYRPEENQWRAHIISSADRRVCWAEEGGGATEYRYEVNDETWADFFEAAKGESVRCIRNIGTYDDGGVKEITGAPYNIRPDQYFSITPEPNTDLSVVDDPDTHYSISFDRLNPKSLRDLSSGELPFSDQYSINNCVYLQMETQSRNDEKKLLAGGEDYNSEYSYPYSLWLDQVNEQVDLLGYNPYCPKGYRFPNQAELMWMSVYLPESFFLLDADGTPYETSKTYMPTRTYFDRGYYGKKTDGFEFDRQGFDGARRREQTKVGWAYSFSRKKNTTARRSDDYKMIRSRCVRDDDKTGTIEGGLLMKDVLYPGDNIPLSFSFYTSGSSFISASLKLCFTDGSGVYHERDIPVEKTPTGLQFLADQTVTIPTLASMGLDGDVLANHPELRNKTNFKVILRNAYQSKTFEQSFTLGNPLDGTFTVADNSHVLLPGENKQLNFNITSQANTCNLASVTLRLIYENSVGVETFNTLAIPGISGGFPYTYLNRSVYIPVTGGGEGQLDLQNDDPTRPATLELTVTDNGGSSKSFTITTVNNKHLQIGEDITPPPFTGFRIKATKANTTVTFDADYADNIQYSIDGGENWVDGTTPGTLVNAGDQMYVKGKGNRTNYKNDSGVDEYGTPADHPLFTTGNKLVYIAGDIMSLLDDASSLSESAFQGTFSRGKTGSTENYINYIDISDSDPLYLPVTNLASRCYQQMFRNCRSLTHAPTFTVQGAAYRCCYNMFRGCSNLADVSTISLPANQMYVDCYREMFRLCSALTTVDSGLLPATQLAESCYQQMFQATGITTAPNLPATALVKSCYSEMFRACASLNYIKCLAQTGINSNGSTSNWVNGVNASGTFVKYSGITWPNGNNGIPTGWGVQGWTPAP